MLSDVTLYTMLLDSSRLPDKDNSNTEKVQIETDLSFIVFDLVYKFQMIFVSYWSETKCRMYGHG
jgi:hypothetical protein